MSMLRRYSPRALVERRAQRRSDALLADAEDGSWRSMRALAAQLNTAGDVEGARAWLMRGIAAGDPDAIYQLGQLIDERFGLDEAEPWFRRAAEAGHPIAKRFFRPGGTFYRDPSDPATGNR